MRVKEIQTRKIFFVSVFLATQRINDKFINKNAALLQEFKLKHKEKWRENVNFVSVPV